MTRMFFWLAALTTIGGCGTTDPTIESMTGRWRGSVNGLGIGFVTLDLVEENHTILGTGEWTPETGTAARTLAAQGLRFDAQIQLSLKFATAADTHIYVLTGRVVGSDAIYLLFPTEPNATRVSFVR